MRRDGWLGEIIVLFSLRKIILSGEYYEPAYDTSIGNLQTSVRDGMSAPPRVRNLKYDIIK